jgi:hypothetical protein
MWDRSSDFSKGWVLLVLYVGITFLFTLLNVVSCNVSLSWGASPPDPQEQVQGPVSLHFPWFNNIVGIQFGALPA